MYVIVPVSLLSLSTSKGYHGNCILRVTMVTVYYVIVEMKHHSGLYSKTASHNGDVVMWCYSLLNAIFSISVSLHNHTYTVIHCGINYQTN